MAIIVGVDGSEHSRRALGWAIEEGRLRGTTVVAVMAYNVSPVYSAYGDLPSPGYAQLVDETRQAAQEELARTLGEVVSGEADRGVETETIEGYQPAHVLTERAKGEDLLVVGSRGRGGFAGLLLGSVSQQCTQHSTCPVVIVPL